MTKTDRQAIQVLRERSNALNDKYIDSKIWIVETADILKPIYKSNSEGILSEIQFALNKSHQFTNDLLNSYINQIIQHGLETVNKNLQNSEMIVIKNTQPITTTKPFDNTLTAYVQ